MAIVDEASLLERLEGDLGFLGEIVGIFLEESDRRVAAIRKAVEAGDGRELQFAAHSLKGSAANLSALEVYETCASLERLGTSGDFDEAPDQLAALEVAMSRLEPALEKLAQQTDLDEPRGQKALG